MSEATTQIGNVSKVARQYAPYVEADWGFANHWYPAAFSHEVEARGVVGVRIGGHDIAITRTDEGVAYGIADRCLHRGVKLSAKPMCFASGEVTCWYHGFTYNAETGNLDTIVGAPEDPLIGTVGVRAYPTEEFAGIIWLFVGDEDFGEPPAIETDLPMRVTDRDIVYFQDEDYRSRHPPPHRRQLASGRRERPGPEPPAGALGQRHRAGPGPVPAAGRDRPDR